MALNIPALVSVIIFYIVTLAIGVWAARKTKKLERDGNQTEVTIVGGRSMNMFVGLFTSTATWVGGGYINGTAEIIYLPDRGLVWLQTALGFALGLILGAIFFVAPMRSKKYLTMMDPIQEAYGHTMTSLLFIPALIGDIFWFAAILASLASTMSVILDIQTFLSIIISALIVIIYTFFGGLYSVAYTDVIQLLFIIFGLCLCFPFAMMNPASVSIARTAVEEVFQSPWLGKLDLKYTGVWIDNMLYVCLGSIPWQVYFQRVLSAATTTQAKVTSVLGGCATLILGTPSILIGAIAASTDWNQTSYGLPTPYERGEASMILPIVLQHLCPQYVAVAGLGAVAAAVMSSADSALLSSSSMFGYNIYKKILRKKATEKEVMIVMKIATVVFGSSAAGFAFLSNSIYDLWFICGELVYALLFPQLVCALFVPGTNTYGSATGFLVGLIMRILGGEQILRIPPIIHYPWCTIIDGQYVQLFPFKTATMLISLATLILVSYFSTFLFRRSILPAHWDIFNVLKVEDTTRGPSNEPELFQLRRIDNNALQAER
ncbi:hypothetical protein GDO86_004718 [Hymenochirus boettgeri]|uniref:High affinity choline transporter 1 n=1 Tax=Hymenochirus boettgeri TaxID=247094 RepID=A0A8T2K9U4_9PIPI|nr:hypothetical protein GDO86_004718 [Hymenochirus boettgeri]